MKNIIKISLVLLVLMQSLLLAHNDEPDYIDTAEGRMYKNQMQNYETKMIHTLNGLFSDFALNNEGNCPGSWEELDGLLPVSLNEIFNYVSPPLTERFSFIESDAVIEELDGSKLLLINNYVIEYPKTKEERRFALALSPEGEVKYYSISEQEVQSILGKYDITIPLSLPYDSVNSVITKFEPVASEQPKGRLDTVAQTKATPAKEPSSPVEVTETPTEESGNNMLYIFLGAIAAVWAGRVVFYMLRKKEEA